MKKTKQPGKQPPEKKVDQKLNQFGADAYRLLQDGAWQRSGMAVARDA
jgi:hypothetical protein